MKKFIKLLTELVIFIGATSCGVVYSSSDFSSTWVRYDKEFEVDEYKDMGVFTISAGRVSDVTTEGILTVSTMGTDDQEVILSDSWVDVKGTLSSIELYTYYCNTGRTCTCWIKQNSTWFKYTIINSGSKTKFDIKNDRKKYHDFY